MLRTTERDVPDLCGRRGKMAVDVARERCCLTREALVNVEQQVLLAAVSAYVDVRLADRDCGFARIPTCG